MFSCHPKNAFLWNLLKYKQTLEIVKWSSIIESLKPISRYFCTDIEKQQNCSSAVSIELSSGIQM